jgi:hypothetical protein
MPGTYRVATILAFLLLANKMEKTKNERRTLEVRFFLLLLTLLCEALTALPATVLAFPLLAIRRRRQKMKKER